MNQPTHAPSSENVAARASYPAAVTTNRLSALLGDRMPLLDGGYGWLLQERGLEAGVPAELWNLTNPEGIAGLHEEYAAAGSTILTTNTFGATAPRLAGYDLAERGSEVAEQGAAIARAVADRHGILVAGDIGPTGELLEPLGTLTVEEAVELFAAQIKGMLRGGIDLILIETMSDLEESKAAITAARREAPDLPIIATMMAMAGDSRAGSTTLPITPSSFAPSPTHLTPPQPMAATVAPTRPPNSPRGSPRPDRASSCPRLAVPAQAPGGCTSPARAARKAPIARWPSCAAAPRAPWASTRTRTTSSSTASRA